ncbi:MAG: translation elongation factor 4 [Candidatus Omnitrophica bacterium]|nr:translation elongation factor 4 [Candidatus Omnitrophota bacterium]MBU4457517.1 translation elongation factor 4 [Candidatus Omnitrophota bacterium]
MDIARIRNFCIIAHIDHGKSTLADRLLQFTHTVDERQFREQVLDDMDLERERGITIKASSVRISYKAKDGNTYELNLIDTPGHVDFSYEVSKSLSACEGAILLVDAAQGVEAQTVANLQQALEKNLKIIPVVNKIDLQSAEPERVAHEIKSILKLDEDSVIMASAKEGTGTEEILERVVRDVPPPKGSEKEPLQALVFDSKYDVYRGVIVYIRVVNGCIKKGMYILMMSSNKRYEVQEVGIFRPGMEPVEALLPGEVGYITCQIKEAKEVTNGDTVTCAKQPAERPLTGHKVVKPMVFAGIYPVNAKDFDALKKAVDKLKLSDASFIYDTESSQSLGFGFRCGFLGLLHMEIVQERLEREYDLDLVLTTPSVVYKVKDNKGKEIEVENPGKLPEPQDIVEILEPYTTTYIMIPHDALSNVIEFCKTKRGEYKSTDYISQDKIELVFEIPLSEIIVDFYDKIKSMTKGYGSLDYEIKEYRPSDLVKLDILINGQPCEALSSIVHRERSDFKGRQLAAKLKELIPRQLFEVIIQAAIGSKILARTRVAPLSKHVTSKCYGGDITRKRKLWEKQKEGKKRLKQFGRVQIPQEAFLAALKI